MILKREFGIPLVTADNYREVFAELGVVPWARTREPVDMDEYLTYGLSEAALAEARRFGPKAEVVFLRQPTGEPFTGFRSVGKDWANVFALLPGDLLVITAEWKHGIEGFVMHPPSGVVGRADRDATDPMLACAKREFEGETGLELAEVLPLTVNGIPVSGRQSTVRFFPHLGRVVEPVTVGPSKLDGTENLRLALMPLADWLTVMDRGEVYEDCAASTTLLALRRLGRLTLMP